MTHDGEHRVGAGSKPALERFGPYLLALVVGLTFVAPQLWFPSTLPEGTFHRMSFSETDGETYYFARVREVMDGHWRLGNAFSADYKDKPVMHLGLLELVFGASGRLTGAHIDGLMIFVKFVLGVLAFVALFRFSLALTGSPLVAAASATLVLLGLDAFLRPWLVAGRLFDPSQAKFLRKPESLVSLSSPRCISSIIGMCSTFTGGRQSVNRATGGSLRRRRKRSSSMMVYASQKRSGSRRLTMASSSVVGGSVGAQSEARFSSHPVSRDTASGESPSSTSW